MTLRLERSNNIILRLKVRKFKSVAPTSQLRTTIFNNFVRSPLAPSPGTRIGVAHELRFSGWMVVELGRIVRSDGEEVYHEDLVIKGERSLAAVRALTPLRGDRRPVGDRHPNHPGEHHRQGQGERELGWFSAPDPGLRSMANQLFDLRRPTAQLSSAGK